MKTLDFEPGDLDLSLTIFNDDVGVCVSVSIPNADVADAAGVRVISSRV